MRAALVLCLLSFVPSPAAAQPAAPPAAAPAAIVRQWLERLNALSAEAATFDAFLALHAPDALVTTGPSPDQRGTATYRGHRGIRVFAERLAARELQRAYRLDTETARETTASLLHETTGPWGGAALAVQIVAAYTDAASRIRYVTPGAVFFQFEGDRIRRVRVYFGEGERAEVEAQPTRRRP